jgi:hypothetical protein
VRLLGGLSHLTEATGCATEARLAATAGSASRLRGLLLVSVGVALSLFAFV